VTAAVTVSILRRLAGRADESIVHQHRVRVEAVREYRGAPSGDGRQDACTACASNRASRTCQFRSQDAK